MRQHEYSILETIQFLHGEHTGTGAMLGEEYRERLAWLRWRVDEGWTPTTSLTMCMVEEGIRGLATRVLAVADLPNQCRRQRPGAKTGGG